MTKEEFRQQIFLELLRSYHNGTGVSRAQPKSKVLEHLTWEADVILRAYYREKEKDKNED